MTKLKIENLRAEIKRLASLRLSLEAERSELWKRVNQAHIELIQTRIREALLTKIEWEIRCQHANVINQTDKSPAPTVGQMRS